ncbi:MAG: hypothetical protein IJ538_00005, partial [Clostridia bacterium]|nr:hypothetical protein [Clostridia bacterium]
MSISHMFSGLTNFLGALKGTIFINGFGTGIGQFFAALGAIILEGITQVLYFICKWLLAFVDFLQYFVQKLIGLDYWLNNTRYTISGATNADLIFKFLYDDTVQRVFRALIGVSIVLLIIFTIYAIIKNEWMYATTGGKDNSKADIVRKALKSIVTVAVFPVLLTLAIISSNAILASLVKALNIGMGQTFGGTLFYVSSQTANKYRAYADSNKRYPISDKVVFYTGTSGGNSTTRAIVLSSGGMMPNNAIPFGYFDEYMNAIKKGDESNPFNPTQNIVRSMIGKSVDGNTDTFGYINPMNGSFSGFGVGVPGNDGAYTYYMLPVASQDQNAYSNYFQYLLGLDVVSKYGAGKDPTAYSEIQKEFSFQSNKYISGKNMNNANHDNPALKYMYNAWSYNTFYDHYETFEDSLNFINLDAGLLQDTLGLESVRTAKLMFNDGNWANYFDGGQLGIVALQSEYYVMADIVDFMNNEGVTLYMMDANSSMINWEGVGTDYKPDSKWIGNKDFKLWDTTYRSFVVSYSEQCSDLEMGNVCYLYKGDERHLTTSYDELQGSKFIMCWKVNTGTSTTYVPVVNGKTFTDSVTGKTYRFSSEYLSNDYRGVIVARGTFDADWATKARGADTVKLGYPTYLKSSSEIGGTTLSDEDMYYYEMKQTGSMNQRIVSSGYDTRNYKITGIIGGSYKSQVINDSSTWSFYKENENQIMDGSLVTDEFVKSLNIKVTGNNSDGEKTAKYVENSVVLTSGEVNYFLFKFQDGNSKDKFFVVEKYGDGTIKLSNLQFDDGIVDDVNEYLSEITSIDLGLSGKTVYDVSVFSNLYTVDVDSDDNLTWKSNLTEVASVDDADISDDDGTTTKYFKFENIYDNNFKKASSLIQSIKLVSIDDNNGNLTFKTHKVVNVNFLSGNNIELVIDGKNYNKSSDSYTRGNITYYAYNATIDGYTYSFVLAVNNDDSTYDLYQMDNSVKVSSYGSVEDYLKVVAGNTDVSTPIASGNLASYTPDNLTFDSLSIKDDASTYLSVEDDKITIDNEKFVEDVKESLVLTFKDENTGNSAEYTYDSYDAGTELYEFKNTTSGITVSVFVKISVGNLNSDGQKFTIEVTSSTFDLIGISLSNSVLNGYVNSEYDNSNATLTITTSDFSNFILNNLELSLKNSLSGDSVEQFMLDSTQKSGTSGYLFTQTGTSNYALVELKSDVVNKKYTVSLVTSGDVVATNSNFVFNGATSSDSSFKIKEQTTENILFNVSSSISVADAVKHLTLQIKNTSGTSLNFTYDNTYSAGSNREFRFKSGTNFVYVVARQSSYKYSILKFLPHVIDLSIIRGNSFETDFNQSYSISDISGSLLEGSASTETSVKTSTTNKDAVYYFYDTASNSNVDLTTLIDSISISYDYTEASSGTPVTTRTISGIATNEGTYSLGDLYLFVDNYGYYIGVKVDRTSRTFKIYGIGNLNEKSSSEINESVFSRDMKAIKNTIGSQYVNALYVEFKMQYQGISGTTVNPYVTIATGGPSDFEFVENDSTDGKMLYRTKYLYGFTGMKMTSRFASYVSDDGKKFVNLASNGNSSAYADYNIQITIPKTAYTYGQRIYTFYLFNYKTFAVQADSSSSYTLKQWNENGNSIIGADYYQNVEDNNGTYFSFKINPDNINWYYDAPYYSLYDAGTYIARLYRTLGNSNADNYTSLDDFISKPAYVFYNYKNYYNVLSQNKYKEDSSANKYYNQLKSSFVVGCFRDNLETNLFASNEIDFRFPNIFFDWNFRFKWFPTTARASHDDCRIKFNVQNGISFDYFFDGPDVSLSTFYIPIPWKINFIILIIGAALIIKVLGSAIWGVIKRIYEITLYFLALPPMAALEPVKEGSIKRITDELTKKVLSTYGVMLGLNVFFILLMPVKSMSQIFTAEDIATSGSYFLQHLPFGANVLNMFVYVLFLLVAFTMIEALPKMVADLVGAGEVVSEGDKTKKAAQSAVKDAADTVSGKKALDTIKTGASIAASAIPARALIGGAIGVGKKVGDWAKSHKKAGEQNAEGGSEGNGDKPKGGSSRKTNETVEKETEAAYRKELQEKGQLAENGELTAEQQAELAKRKQQAVAENDAMNAVEDQFIQDLRDNGELGEDGLTPEQQQTLQGLKDAKLEEMRKPVVAENGQVPPEGGVVGAVNKVLETAIDAHNAGESAGLADAMLVAEGQVDESTAARLAEAEAGVVDINSVQLGTIDGQMVLNAAGENEDVMADARLRSILESNDSDTLAMLGINGMDYNAIKEDPSKYNEVIETLKNNVDLKEKFKPEESQIMESAQALAADNKFSVSRWDQMSDQERQNATEQMQSKLNNVDANSILNGADEATKNKILATTAQSIMETDSSTARSVQDALLASSISDDDLKNMSSDAIKAMFGENADIYDAAGNLDVNKMRSGLSTEQMAKLGFMKANGLDLRTADMDQIEYKSAEFDDFDSRNQAVEATKQAYLNAGHTEEQLNAEIVKNLGDADAANGTNVLKTLERAATLDARLAGAKSADGLGEVNQTYESGHIRTASQSAFEHEQSLALVDDNARINALINSNQIDKSNITRELVKNQLADGEQDSILSGISDELKRKLNKKGMSDEEIAIAYKKAQLTGQTLEGLSDDKLYSTLMKQSSPENDANVLKALQASDAANFTTNALAAIKTTMTEDQKQQLDNVAASSAANSLSDADRQKLEEKYGADKVAGMSLYEAQQLLSGKTREEVLTDVQQGTERNQRIEALAASGEISSMDVRSQLMVKGDENQKRHATERFLAIAGGSDPEEQSKFLKERFGIEIDDISKLSSEQLDTVLKGMTTEEFDQTYQEMDENVINALKKSYAADSVDGNLQDFYKQNKDEQLFARLAAENGLSEDEVNALKGHLNLGATDYASELDPAKIDEALGKVKNERAGLGADFKITADSVAAVKSEVETAYGDVDLGETDAAEKLYKKMNKGKKVPKWDELTDEQRKQFALDNADQVSANMNKEDQFNVLKQAMGGIDFDDDAAVAGLGLTADGVEIKSKRDIEAYAKQNNISVQEAVSRMSAAEGSVAAKGIEQLNQMKTATTKLARVQEFGKEQDLIRDKKMVENKANQATAMAIQGNAAAEAKLMRLYEQMTGKSYLANKDSDEMKLFIAQNKDTIMEGLSETTTKEVEESLKQHETELGVTDADKAEAAALQQEKMDAKAAGIQVDDKSEAKAQNWFTRKVARGVMKVRRAGIKTGVGLKFAGGQVNRFRRFATEKVGHWAQQTFVGKTNYGTGDQEQDNAIAESAGAKAMKAALDEGSKIDKLKF